MSTDQTEHGLTGGQGMPLRARVRAIQRLKHRLRTDMAFRRAFVDEARSSLAFSGYPSTSAQAEKCLDQVLDEPWDNPLHL